MMETSEVVVLHVGRGEDAFLEARVRGARYLPLAAVAVDRNGQRNVLPPAGELGRALRGAGVSHDVPVVLYGEMRGLAAARGFFALDASGHPAVAVLDGGLAAWVEAGYETASGAAPAVAQGDFVPRLDDDRIATAREVAALVEGGRGVRMDARPPAQYTGELPGDGVERPGHIPGAVSLFWEEDLDADGRLLPLDELRARYERAGAEAGEPVVVYCRTGVQASHAYLVARLLGLDPALYDGSYLEWSNDTDYPVETGG
jgi:thiosulfate/3-mercaptopyruvate sulfurtransferase